MGNAIRFIVSGIIFIIIGILLRVKPELIRSIMNNKEVPDPAAMGKYTTLGTVILVCGIIVLIIGIIGAVVSSR